MKLDHTSQSRAMRPRTDLPEIGAFGTSQETLSRITGMIELGTVAVNSLIGLRFLLKLMAANSENAFAQLVDVLTAPFLAIFVGLTDTPSFDGIVIEGYDLIAILFCFALGWALIRVLRILFARLKPQNVQDESPASAGLSFSTALRIPSCLE
ncbi:MAG: hypothetical protein V1755_08295 [Chloroflexota bacterium]